MVSLKRLSPAKTATLLQAPWEPGPRGGGGIQVSAEMRHPLPRLSQLSGSAPGPRDRVPMMFRGHGQPSCSCESRTCVTRTVWIVSRLLFCVATVLEWRAPCSDHARLSQLLIFLPPRVQDEPYFCRTRLFSRRNPQKETVHFY